MPQYEGQLGDLFALLTKFQQSSLPSVLVEKIGDEGHGTPVVLRDIAVIGILTVAGELTRASKTVEVLLLLLLNGGCCCSGHLLLLLLGMGVMRARLLVHPCRVSSLRVELVVSVDVRRWHHDGRIFSCSTEFGTEVMVL
jgi:hypothetical protein